MTDKPTPLTDAQIKHMVNRFLMWKLPKPLHPDNGISFTPSTVLNPGTPYENDLWPTGTNLWGYTEAEVMVRHMIEGMSVEAETDRDRLSRFFREERPDMGFEGDIEGWNPIESAMHFLRRRPDHADALADIADMMANHVDNWPMPKRLKTAIALIGKTLDAMVSIKTSNELEAAAHARGKAEGEADALDEVVSMVVKMCPAPTGFATSHTNTMRVMASDILGGIRAMIAQREKGEKP